MQTTTLAAAIAKEMDLLVKKVARFIKTQKEFYLEMSAANKFAGKTGKK